MKITVEVEPEEFAKMLSTFIDNSHKSYREAEERIGNQILSGIMKLNGQKGKDTKDEEVPTGGYFH